MSIWRASCPRRQFERSGRRERARSRRNVEYVEIVLSWRQLIAPRHLCQHHSCRSQNLRLLVILEIDGLLAFTPGPDEIPQPLMRFAAA
jgi:hypothetical protein